MMRRCSVAPLSSSRRLSSLASSAGTPAHIAPQPASAAHVAAGTMAFIMAERGTAAALAAFGSEMPASVVALCALGSLAAVPAAGAPLQLALPWSCCGLAPSGAAVAHGARISLSSGCGATRERHADSPCTLLHGWRGRHMRRHRPRCCRTCADDGASVGSAVRRVYLSVDSTQRSEPWRRGHHGIVQAAATVRRRLRGGRSHSRVRQPHVRLLRRRGSGASGAHSGFSCLRRSGVGC